MAARHITLQVPEEAARRFHEATPEQRRTLENQVAFGLLSGRRQPVSLDQAIEAIRREAQANGLTPEILKNILGEDKVEGCF